AGIDKQTDGDGQLAPGEQVIEHVWHALATSLAHVAAAVLEDHQRGGFGAVVLRRDIYPAITRGVREDLGLGENELLDASFGRAGRTFGGFWPELVFRCGIGQEGQRQACENNK